jgi:hypothetical protein
MSHSATTPPQTLLMLYNNWMMTHLSSRDLGLLLCPVDRPPVTSFDPSLKTPSHLNRCRLHTSNIDSLLKV